MTVSLAAGKRRLCRWSISGGGTFEHEEIKNGLRYVYTGNVHDEEGSSTYCHACGQKLIGRDWYTLTAWNLTDDGRCRTCGTPCAGVFDGKPGNWGPRRLPVQLTPAFR